MALIFEGVTRCAICGELAEARPYTATTDGAFDPSQPLWKFCDAALHFDCLERWPHRAEFARGNFLACKEYSLRFGGVLWEESTWFLACGPCQGKGSPLYASIQLGEWPISIYTPWNEWAACVAGGYRDGLAGKALLAADSVVAEVRERVPDPASLTALLERRRREGRVSGTSEEEIAEFSDEAIRERQAENLRNDLDWAGKLRRCPRCSVVFASVRDRGACPGCGHVFYASRPEEGGR
jgi:ribosomal protein S27AE